LKLPETYHPSIMSWVRSEKEKAETFAEDLSKVLKSNSREITLKKENRLLFDDTTPATQDTSIRSFIVNEVKAVIKYLNPKKALDYNLNQIL